MTVRGLHLHVDCASGAAGDMMLGALIDLGASLDAIGDALDAIGAGRSRLHVNRVVKHGIAAVDVKVDTSGGHAHTPYGAIRERITGAKLTDRTRARALDIFDRLARAEAKLHGSTIDAVEFHEVGAIDSIVDVVGTAAALDALAPSSMSCASVAMGHGFVRSAHGILPVPAPAALEVLREAGGVMADGGLPRELCTPTGAAILAASVTSWTAAPTGRAVATGWGAGDLDFADRPNVLRVVMIERTGFAGPRSAPEGERGGLIERTGFARPRSAPEGERGGLIERTGFAGPCSAPEGERGGLIEPAAGAAAAVWQIDANIDDMTGELCAPAADAAFAAGALDVWWTPVTMKKGRPALVLSVLAEPATKDAVIAAILRETTTIGVRCSLRERTVLARKTVEVATPYGPIAIKLALDGDVIRNAAPEYEACAEAARRAGVPVKLVYAAALAAYAGSR